MTAANALKDWVAGLDRRLYALLVGGAVGLLAALIALGLAHAGPIITGGAIVGVLAALYVLSDVRVALYGLLAVLVLLPFGTFPFEIVFTPTLIDAALGAFLVVYLMLWMTGQRRNLHLTPVHALILLYALWFGLAFVLGLRYGPPTPNRVRQFAESLLAISVTFVLVDLVREPGLLRRLVLLLLGVLAAQALIVLTLYALPDATAERQLIRLARIGYPGGGVIRYVEDNPAQPERAIGTWVDPNVLGGALGILAALVTPQAFAARPVLRPRWLTLGVLGVVGLALLLTFSRAAMLGLAVGLLLMALLRYRWLFGLMAVAGVAVLLLPQTQFYVQRFVEGFQGQDLATQMRIGEYTDALRLIQRYPVFGVGFTGTPVNDVYTDVASMYLIMANQIGLVGVALFLLAMAGVFVYGWRAWRVARHDDELNSVLFGAHAALLAVLTTSVLDLYYFRLDFQASITLFWLVVALALCSSRLALARHAPAPTNH